jgi:hypothetical protein
LWSKPVMSVHCAFSYVCKETHREALLVGAVKFGLVINAEKTLVLLCLVNVMQDESVAKLKKSGNDLE